MRRRTLQGRVSRSLAMLALATYASAGVFGYGLHALWHCEHCPTESAAHCHNHAGHDHGSAHSHEHSTPEQSTPLQSSVATSHDDCTICSFLAQAQTSVVPRLALDGVEPLTEAPLTAAALVMAVAAETPQARGPPLA